MQDIIIIGGGFAGYTAGLYTARYGLKTLLISSEPGAITKAHEVCNYPGFEKISGMDLMIKFQSHAKKEGIDEITDQVVGIVKLEKGYKVVTKSNKELETKAVILAMGNKQRHLNIPGEKEYEGKGVHYCATCDAGFYKDRVAAVVGGSNSAASAAILLSRFAKKVYVIYRKGEMRCEPIMLEHLRTTKNIEIIYDTNIKEIKGEQFVEKVILDKEYEGNAELKLDGVFVEIGSVPSSAIAKELGIKLSENEEIITNKKGETNIEGIYAAGDVTNTVLRQGIVAASQGAIAATSAYSYLTGKKMGSGW